MRNKHKTMLLISVILTLSILLTSCSKKDNQSDSNNEEIDIYKDFASSIQDQLPDLTQDEIADIGRQELTDEQIAKADKVFDKYATGNISEITEFDEETGELYGVNEDGEEVRIILDDEQQQILNMTDDEAENYSSQLLEALENDTIDEVLPPESELDANHTPIDDLPPLSERRVENQIDLDMLDALKSMHPELSEEQIKDIFYWSLYIPTDEEIQSVLDHVEANKDVKWGQ